MGNFTYGIYLIHSPLLIYLRGNSFIPSDPINTPIEIGFWVLLMSTIISIPVYYLFEMPIKNIIISKLGFIYNTSKDSDTESRACV